MAEPRHGAVILAGGAGRRLGGADKPGLVVGGRTLLDTAIDASEGCAEIVVVGPRRTTLRTVCWTSEEPPGGGPLAALAAGVESLTSAVESVVVLAADLPSITSGTVARLRQVHQSSAADAVLLTDEDGHRQPLTALYDRAALNAALNAIGEVRDEPMRGVLDHLRIATLVDPASGEDIDTADDLARWV